MLAESGAYQAVYLNDLTIFYLRCRFACNSLPLRNLRLLWICADLLLPAKAALLGLAAICALSIAVDYTAPKQDSRAAADNRSRGKLYSSSKRGFAARRQSHSGGITTVQAPDCQSKTFLSGDQKGDTLFLEREYPPLPAFPASGGKPTSQHGKALFENELLKLTRIISNFRCASFDHNLA